MPNTDSLRLALAVLSGRRGHSVGREAAEAVVLDAFARLEQRVTALTDALEAQLNLGHRILFRQRMAALEAAIPKAIPSVDAQRYGCCGAHYGGPHDPECTAGLTF